jgi:2-iminobutanoate/2-iminopropanoate deaminase
MKTECIAAVSAPKAIGPYSPAIRAGGWLFISGQLGIDPTTGELASGVKAQTERALANMEMLLSAAGLGFDHLAKTTLFLADIGDFPAVNEVYASVFREPYPARSTVQVAALPKGALVEIEAVAVY